MPLGADHGQGSITSSGSRISSILPAKTIATDMTLSVKSSELICRPFRDLEANFPNSAGVVERGPVASTRFLAALNAQSGDLLLQVPLQRSEDANIADLDQRQILTSRT